MEITIITPLFPPDVSAPAVYAKSLAEHLAAHHETMLRVIHYGTLPETVPGVTMVSIESRTWLPLRILACLRAIWHARTSDYFIVLNGPSVELPFLLTYSLLKKPCLYIQNDYEARDRERFFSQSLRKNLERIALATITPPETVLHKPIKHPLKPAPAHHDDHYRELWAEHLSTILNYVKS